MKNDKLLPCPFCGGKATIKWEAWKEISETSGVYRLTANHSRECFFKRMIGYDPNGEMISNDKGKLAEAWNTRKPMERIVEKMEKWKNYYKKIYEGLPKGNVISERAQAVVETYEGCIEYIKGGVNNAE